MVSGLARPGVSRFLSLTHLYIGETETVLVLLVATISLMRGDQKSIDSLPAIGDFVLMEKV